MIEFNSKQDLYSAVIFSFWYLFFLKSLILVFEILKTKYEHIPRWRGVMISLDFFLINLDLVVKLIFASECTYGRMQIWALNDSMRGGGGFFFHMGELRSKH